MPDTPICVHHWKIRTPKEGLKYRTGICKKCGAKKKFKVSFDGFERQQ